MEFKVNMSICRVCMKPKKGLSLLEDADLRDKFVFTTHLKIKEDDSMPKIVCERCAKILHISFEFIRMANAAEKKLKSFLTKMSNDFELVVTKSPRIDFSEYTDGDESILVLFKDDDIWSGESKKSYIEQGDKYDSSKNERILEFQNTCLDDEGRTTEDEFIYLEDVLIEKEDEDDEEGSDIINSGEVNMIGCLRDDDDNAQNEVIDEELLGNEESAQNISKLKGQIEYSTILHDKSKNSSNLDDENSMEVIRLYDGELLKDQDIQNDLLDSAQTVLVLESNSESQGEMITNTKTNSSKTNRTVRRTKKANTSLTRFVCEKCNRDFSTKTNLTRHMATHQGNKPFMCKICSKSFTQNGSLKQHMLTHTGEKPYVCEVCNRGFTQCKSLVFHMRRHTGEKPFPCDHCGLYFRQKDGLKAHILKHHLITDYSSGAKTHICAICEEILETQQSLQEHMKKHVNNHKPPNTISNVSTDKESEVYMDLIEEDDILVDKASNVGADDINTAAHIVDVMTSTAEPTRVKKYQCRKCFKCFAIKRNLIRHLAIHDIAIPTLNCNDCQMEFDSNFALKHHRVWMHNETDINLNKCEDCHAEFQTEEEIKKHECSVTDLSCPECPFLIFKSQKLLSEHLSEHELNEH